MHRHTICKCGDTRLELPISASHLFAIGQVSRSWKVASVDSVSDHAIETLLSRCRAEAPIHLLDWQQTQYSQEANIVYPESKYVWADFAVRMVCSSTPISPRFAECC